MSETHHLTIPSPQRVVLVGVKLKTQLKSDVEDSLEELGQLAETAGFEVLYKIVQPRDTPDPAHFIGAGKLKELGALMSEAGADAAVFDNELTPAQTRNIEKALDTVAIDRTSLILEIFAQRAQTKEAKLQVELAQLQYALPRLTRMWTHLSRLATGGGGSTAVGAGRTGGAVRGAGRVDRGGLHHGVDGVPVAFGRLQGFDGVDERSLRAHVPIGFRVKGMALAFRADDAQGVEGGAHPGRAQVVHGPDHGLLAVAVPQGTHRGVQGGKAGGTRRAIGGGRPHQVEVV